VRPDLIAECRQSSALKLASHSKCLRCVAQALSGKWPLAYRQWALAVRSSQLRGDRRSAERSASNLGKRMLIMSTTVLRRRPGTSRGLRSTTQLLDVNAELGVATVKVDLDEVIDATAQVGTAVSLPANALIGKVFAGRLLGWDISPTKSKLDVAIPDPNPVLIPGLPGHRTASLARSTAVEPAEHSCGRCCRA
jgi:hypothetical protein